MPRCTFLFVVTQTWLARNTLLRLQQLRYGAQYDKHISPSNTLIYDAIDIISQLCPVPNCLYHSARLISESIHCRRGYTGTEQADVILAVLADLRIGRKGPCLDTLLNLLRVGDCVDKSAIPLDMVLQFRYYKPICSSDERVNRSARVSFT